MISRTQKGLTGLIELNMRAQHISDWALLDEFSNTPRAREIRGDVLDQKSPW
jgi:hypothetical protein